MPFIAPFNSMSLRSDGDKILVLDQRKLPDVEEWSDGTEPTAMIALIKSLAVRGAPLIGLAAAASLAVHAHTSKKSDADMRKVAAELREARPTAVNLMVCMDRMTAGEMTPERLSRVFKELYLSTFFFFNFFF